MTTLVVTAALISKHGRILVTQRREGDDWGLHWEFPGGKLEDNEEPTACIKRELQEELGIGIEVDRIQHAIFKRYESFNILLLVYSCTIQEGVPRAIACEDVQWVDETELKDLKMPPADDDLRDELLRKGLWALNVA